MGKNKKNVRTENKLDQYFKDQLHDVNMQPPQFMWDNIEEQLDTQREKVKFDHWYYIILALLIPFTISNLFINYNIDSHLDNFYERTNKQIASLFTNDSNSIAEINNPNIKISFTNNARNNKKDNFIVPPINPSKKFSSKSKLNKTLLSVRSNKLINTNSSPDTIILSQEAISNLNAQSAGILFHSNEEIEFFPLKNQNIDIENTIEKKLDNLKGFFLGADMKLNNSWFLIKRNKLGAFLSQDVQYNFNYGYAYGVSWGYNFSKSFGLESEIIYSHQGQSYIDNTIRKIPIEGDIELTYIQLPVLAKYRWARVSGITQKPVAFNVLLGPVYSYLVQSNYLVNNDELLNEKEIIPQHELGLSLGLEYDIFMSNNTYFTLGARTSVSSDVQSFPFIGSNNLKTINLLVGINASVNFQIRPKQKSPTNI